MLMLLFCATVLSGPIFSFLLTYLTDYLNSNLGDWLSYYGAIDGIIISLVVIHLQLSIDKEREKSTHRPVLFLENDYQVIKSGCPIYYHDKYWFGLTKRNTNTKGLTTQSFKDFYSSPEKRDKALSMEIVNNQPIFNVQIQFGDSESFAIIPKLSENQNIYIISREHQHSIYSFLLNGDTSFDHVPDTIKLNFTTLVGEKIYQEYKVDDKQFCILVKEKFDVKYLKLPEGNHICDYFIK